MLGQLHVQIVILACVAGRRRGGKETPATQANRYLTFDQTYGPYALGEFLFILQKYLSSVLRSTSANDTFRPTKILSSRTNLQRRQSPATEKDKFLSSVKIVRFYNLQALIRLKMSIK